LITGAASGLGKGIAKSLARLGCVVVLWDVNETGLLSVADEITASGGKVYIYTCDPSKREAVYMVAEKVKKEVGHVDILVNNAGIVTGKKFLQSPDDLIEKTFAVNTIAHFWTAKAFLPGMLQRDKGHIVTIASSAGLVGVSGLADYCASKFAAVGFDESLRQELEGTGVRTTCVCPYFINTGMFDGVVSKFPSLLPILPEAYAVEQITDAILTGKEVLIMPWFASTGLLLKGLLPARAVDEIGKFFGLRESMNDFKGRN